MASAFGVARAPLVSISQRIALFVPFAEMTGVRPMIEKYPLTKAAEAYARMMSGKAEFRVVLTM